VAIRDPRGQLFDAAERVLLRDGAAALTSRAVTAEAGVAKGVLHRHFADFDAFLAELALDRIARIDSQAAELRAAAGTGSVAGNLAAAVARPRSAPLPTQADNSKKRSSLRYSSQNLSSDPEEHDTPRLTRTFLAVIYKRE